MVRKSVASELKVTSDHLLQKIDDGLMHKLIIIPSTFHESMNGWWNKLARINLTSKEVKHESIGEDILRDYIGGRGLGARLLIDEIDPNCDPFEDNVLIFTSGPLTGTPIPTSGRFSASSKSPLTGTIFDSNIGGSFGKEFKKTGIDALIIEGKADEPSVIKITDDDITVEKTDLWGCKTTPTIKNLEGKSLVIGPAGEKKVRYASIMSDDHRAFGRGGLGALMGEKKVKGIIAGGSKKIPIANRKQMKDLIKKASSKISSSPVTSRGLKKFGTPILVNLIAWLGMFSKNNYRESAEEDEAEILSGEKMKSEIVEKHTGCYSCPIRCGLKTKTREKNGKGPEYESVWALGANLGIFDLEKTTEINYLCNELGLDTISTGGTLAAFKEMIEKDILSKNIDFDNDVETLIEKIAKRKDLGDELAEGSRRLCEKYNCDLSMSVKGLELPAYDPRGAAGQALSYITSNRGGCHLRGYLIGEEIFGVPKLFDRFKTSGKAEIVKRAQERNAFLDSLIMCKFSSFALDEDFYSRFLTSVSGSNYTTSDLHEIGERIYNLERYFNAKAGFRRKDDKLPKRFNQPLEKGASSDNTFDMKVMLDKYYELMGWTKDGRPKKETLNRLGIPLID